MIGGGYSSITSPGGIDCFKKSFGGEIIDYWNCYATVSFRGETIELLRENKNYIRHAIKKCGGKIKRNLAVAMKRRERDTDA